MVDLWTPQAEELSLIKPQTQSLNLEPKGPRLGSHLFLQSVDFRWGGNRSTRSRIISVAEIQITRSFSRSPNLDPGKARSIAYIDCKASIPSNRRSLKVCRPLFFFALSLVGPSHGIRGPQLTIIRKDHTTVLLGCRVSDAGQITAYSHRAERIGSYDSHRQRVMVLST